MKYLVNNMIASKTAEFEEIKYLQIFKLLCLTNKHIYNENQILILTQFI